MWKSISKPSASRVIWDSDPQDCYVIVSAASRARNLRPVVSPHSGPMKKNGSLNQHLVLRELVMLPAGEWSPRLPGWTFVYVSRGIGYWLHPDRNQELVAGSALIFAECVQGLIRASQLGE